MSVSSVGFIGGGRVARILLGGLKAKGHLPEKVRVFDVDAGAARKLSDLVPEVDVTMDRDQAATCQMVFLAVHPPALKEAVSGIGAHLRPESLVVSLVPKFTIEALSALLDGFDRIARVIPNAPSLLGRGFNPVVFGEGLSADDRSDLRGLFGVLGDFPEVREGDLESYALLSGMGPGYFWPQLYELRSLGKSFGMDEDAAMEALDKMLWGTVATMRESGLSRAEVEDLIPVKPMGEATAVLETAYRETLSALLKKIRP